MKKLMLLVAAFSFVAVTAIKAQNAVPAGAKQDAKTNTTSVSKEEPKKACSPAEMKACCKKGSAAKACCAHSSETKTSSTSTSTTPATTTKAATTTKKADSSK